MSWSVEHHYRSLYPRINPSRLRTAGQARPGQTGARATAPAASCATAGTARPCAAAAIRAIAAEAGAAFSPARPQPAVQAAAQRSAKPAPMPARAEPAYGGAYHGGVKAGAPTNGGVHPSGVPQLQSQVRGGFQKPAPRRGPRSTSPGSAAWRLGYRVPDDRFRMYFGSGHFFQIGSLRCFLWAAIRASNTTDTGLR